MSVATLPYERVAPRTPAAETRHQRADGSTSLAFARDGGASVLAELYQRSPCRVLFPRTQACEAPLAVLVNVSGGLAGGDRIAVYVEAKAGAAATVTTQAAEKIYRSLGPDARVEARFSVGEGARLEWLPQESILFDGACLDRGVTADVAEGGRLLACEMLVFGRIARGETMTRGRVREAWRILRGGRLVWIDRLGLSGAITAKLDGMGFGGTRALATAIFVGPDAAEKLPLAREAAEGAATLVNGVLIARLLGAEPARVRDRLARVVSVLRGVAGAPPLWAI